MGDRIKYPRTWHLPWSEAFGEGDHVAHNDKVFHGVNVVVTEKMDGENSTLYYDGYFHARSIDGNSHPSQSWLKANLYEICDQISEDMRICGENLYATHSIKYDNLPSYFMGFSAWRLGYCLDWCETLKLFEKCGVVPVPVIYEGVYDKDKIHESFLGLDHESEGYVIRTVSGFDIKDFQRHVAKYVRANHVQTDAKHWRSCWDSKKVNGLKK